MNIKVNIHNLLWVRKTFLYHTNSGAGPQIYPKEKCLRIHFIVNVSVNQTRGMKSAFILLLLMYWS